MHEQRSCRPSSNTTVSASLFVVTEPHRFFGVRLAQPGHNLLVGSCDPSLAVHHQYEDLRLLNTCCSLPFNRLQTARALMFYLSICLGTSEIYPSILAHQSISVTSRLGHSGNVM